MQYDAIMFALITTPTGNTFELRMYSTSLGGGANESGAAAVSWQLCLWLRRRVQGHRGRFTTTPRAIHLTYHCIRYSE